MAKSTYYYLKSRFFSGHPLSSEGGTPNPPQPCAGDDQKRSDFLITAPLTLHELLYFSLDLKSTYKSLWLGTVLICWRLEYPGREFSISWRPD